MTPLPQIMQTTSHARWLRLLADGLLLLGLTLWPLSLLAAPLGLLDIYHEAQANDPLLAAAGSANLAAQEVIEQAKAAYRPAVSLTAGANANRSDLRVIGPTPFPGGRNNFEGYQTRLEARQPIFRKETLERIDQSKVQVSMADKQYHLTQQQLMLRTTQAYFEVLMAEDKLTVLAAQQAAIQRQLAQAQAMFQAGTATITDVNEAQARADLLTAQDISAHNDHEIAQRSLQALIGKPAPLLASLGETALPALARNSMQDWQNITAASNLQIQMQQEAVQISEKDIEVARAGHYPTVDAVASYVDSYANGGQYGFGGDLKNATVGVELSIPLYQGGAVNSKIRQADALRQKALDDLQQVIRQTTLDTQRAYLTLQNSQAQVQALTQALHSSRSQLEATSLGYEQGIRTSVDVLNAQQQVFATQRELLQARYQVLINHIRLKTVSGIVSEADLLEIDQQLAKR